MVIRKTDLIKQVAEETGLPQTTVKKVLESSFAHVKAHVVARDQVQIAEFGSFVSKDRNARTATNPRTGEKVPVPETTVPAFRPSKTWKEMF